VVAVAGVVSAFVTYVIRVDPSFNGRTPVWSEFLRLWKSSPLAGVGESGISDQIAAGTLPGWATHGHNLVLDPLGRVGLIGTIPIVSAVIAGLVIAWASGRRGLVVSAAILATFLASGISEDLIDWRYAGVQFVPFLLAGLLGATWIRRRSASPME
jgi:O-antigen ligase